MNPYGMEIIERNLFVTLSKDRNGMYFIHNDWNYVDKFYADSDEEAKRKFRERQVKANEKL